MEGEFPKTLYRDGGEFVWDGRPTDRLVVASAEEQTRAVAEGWREAAEYLQATPGRTDLLDGNAKVIEAALPDMDLDALETLKAAELAGKTRKGVLSMIEAEIDKRLA